MRGRRFPLLLSPVLALAACGTKEAPKPPPPAVGYIVARPTTVPVAIELPGRTTAYQTSDVRPQVAGILQARLFREGGLVRQGQPLYRIDPRVYRAAVGQAEGNFAGARANAVTARARAERFGDLVKINAVSKQDADDARAQAGQAEASIKQTAAALDNARVNLGFATVRAPISGRIGRSLVTVGALVSNAQETALSTIQTLDPIFVDIQQSAGQLLALRRAMASGGALPASAPVRLKLEDGSDYGRTGRLEFAEVTVDPSTSAVTLRARFANPDGMLLPGLFVRAVVSEANRPGVFPLPARAVTLDPRGGASVVLVGPGNKAVVRNVETMGLKGGNWIVTSGIRAGDRVIVSGGSTLRPGQPVRPRAVGAAPAQG